MSKVGFSEALRTLESGAVASHYLFIGDNYYQRFFLTELILKQVLPPGGRAYNKYELPGAKATPQLLEEPLYAVSLLGDTRVVILTDLNRLPSSSQDFLLKSLQALDDSVVFVGSANKLDMRKKFSQALAKLCTVVELKELSNKVLPRYIRSRFQAHGLAVDEEGVIEFCRVVGRDCGEIEREVEKAANRFGDGARLSAAEVRSLLSASRHFSRFEVAEYMAHRQLARALTALSEVLSSGGSEARGLPWACYQKLERLMLYKKLAGALSSEDLAGRLRMPPFYMKDLQIQSGKWEEAELVSALRALHAAEIAERFSQEPKRQIWERALIQIIGQRGE